MNIKNRSASICFCFLFKSTEKDQYIETNELIRKFPRLEIIIVNFYLFIYIFIYVTH